MVIDDLNIFRPVIPTKADSILVIYPDAVMTFSVTNQSLQPVAWWRAEVSQFLRAGQHFQVTSRDRFKVDELVYALPTKQLLRPRASKRLYHCQSVYRRSINDKISGVLNSRFSMGQNDASCFVIPGLTGNPWFRPHGSRFAAGTTRGCFLHDSAAFF
jgi:hypothetical protein